MGWPTLYIVKAKKLHAEQDVEVYHHGVKRTEEWKKNIIYYVCLSLYREILERTEKCIMDFHGKGSMGTKDTGSGKFILSNLY